jgi:esterase/lipase
MTTPDSPHHPSLTHAEAIERLTAWLAEQPAAVNPANGMRWWTRSEKRPRAVVLFHGYTNCPRQFYQLGELFFQQGDNVFIPCFPGHAHHDRMTAALAGLTADQIMENANRAVDIAHGLGERVAVVGLSMGGVLAGWMAQTRPDVDQVMFISPALGVQAVPAPLTSLAIRLFQLLPNQFRWWDPDLKDAPIPPLHAYPRFSTHGLVQILNLGQSLLRAARQAPPKARSVIVVINPTDEAIDVQAVEQLVSYWKANSDGQVRSYTFPASHDLRHDLIDPEQPYQQVDLVYPKLVELMG